MQLISTAWILLSHSETSDLAPVWEFFQSSFENFKPRYAVTSFDTSIHESLQNTLNIKVFTSYYHCVSVKFNNNKLFNLEEMIIKYLKMFKFFRKLQVATIKW